MVGLLTCLLASRQILYQAQPLVIYENGNIYTGDPKHPHAHEIVVKYGKIWQVDQLGHIDWKGVRHVDLHGATVVPGLVDAHCHLSGVGQREVTLNLEGTQSLKEFLTRVKERVDETPKGKWVTGRGWIENAWHPQAFPTRQDLDSVSPNNPVYLLRADGHGAVANSMALKLAKVTKDTKNPFGGEIMHDPKTGEPNGMLLDSAHGLIEGLLPRETDADIERDILLGVKRSLEMGLTEVHIPGNSWREIGLIRKLYREGKIKIRIYDAVIGVGGADRMLKDGPSIGEFDNHFTLRGMKFYADGALGSKGAALLDKYSDYDSTGFLSYRHEGVEPLWQEALKKGVQIWTHAIGDRGNRTTLDWYEEAFNAIPKDQRKVQDPRWRIEHAQIVADIDVPRFKQLGVIPSMQPSHAIGDFHFAKSRLGADRLHEGYRWKDFIKQGSIVPGGSDAPVEQGNPMIEFYSAVYRHDLKGYADADWHLDQAVTREEALNMFTKWAAYAAFEEKDRGTIQVGKLADMTVLSADIMKIPYPQIPKVRATQVIVGGEVVYRAKN